MNIHVVSEDALRFGSIAAIRIAIKDCDVVLIEDQRGVYVERIERGSARWHVLMGTQQQPSVNPPAAHTTTLEMFMMTNGFGAW